MEEVYQNEECYENDERQELQSAIQAKKEKFRIMIRQSKNKQLFQAKRMKLANGMKHIPTNNIDQNNEKIDKKTSKDYIMAQEMQFTKDDILRGIEKIIGYLLDGAYHEDIEQLIQVVGSLNYLINIGDYKLDILDTKLVNNALLLIINITYYCDKQQMKYFSNNEILNSIMKLLYSEDIQVREYFNDFLYQNIQCLTTIVNIIQEDKNTIKYLMDRFFAQEVISLVTTYALSNEIVLEIASIIKLIVEDENIPYSSVNYFAIMLQFQRVLYFIQKASEFLIPVDELIDFILQQNINDETDSSSLSELVECVYVILNKEDNEDIYENFVLEYPRLLVNMLDTVKAIQFNQKFNSVALAISQVIGLLLSGNIKTTEVKLLLLFFQQKLIENDIFDALKTLIKHPFRDIRKEAMWSVSNLFVFSEIKILKEYLMDLEFWDIVCNIAFSDYKSVSKWGYVSILNAIILNNIEFIDLILERFCESDLINFIFQKLQDKIYSDVIISLLEALKSLIGYGEYCQKKNDYEENHIIVLIQRINSRPILEQYQNNLEEDVYKVSGYLLDKVF